MVNYTKQHTKQVTDSRDSPICLIHLEKPNSLNLFLRLHSGSRAHYSRASLVPLRNAESTQQEENSL